MVFCQMSGLLSTSCPRYRKRYDLSPELLSIRFYDFKGGIANINALFVCKHICSPFISNLLIFVILCASTDYK